MARVEFELINGLTLGKEGAEITHKKVVLRDLTAGDLEDASEESEKIIYANGEPSIVVSPTKMNSETLRRQILSVGDITGPLPHEMLRKLTSPDFELIQAKAAEMDTAGQKAVEAALARGRSDQTTK